MMGERVGGARDDGGGTNNGKDLGGGQRRAWKDWPAWKSVFARRRNRSCTEAEGGRGCSTYTGTGSSQFDGLAAHVVTTTSFGQEATMRIRIFENMTGAIYTHAP